LFDLVKAVRLKLLFRNLLQDVHILFINIFINNLEQVNANDGNNQPEQNYYFAYKNGREVRVPYIKSNWWEAVDYSYQ